MHPEHPALFDVTDMRKWDLPPTWDRHPVAWEPWQPRLIIFLCPPPPRAPRTACGLIRPKAEAQGCFIHPVPEADGAQVPAKRGRLLASRCTHCAHDTVLDITTGQVWDLDHSDYGDAGSNPP